MTYNTQTPIANGGGYEDVKSRLVTLAETWLGAGQASGGNVPATWGDMRTKLNLILTAFGKTTIGSGDSGATARAKINGIIDAESLLAGTALAWWNADRADLLTLVGSAVSSWKDSINAYDMTQGVSSARPTYSATGFNGSPGLTLDGSDDCLAMATQPFPAGAGASELWGTVQQDALAADAANRDIFGYGGDVGTNRRWIQRIVASGANRFNAQVGDGSTSLG